MHIEAEILDLTKETSGLESSPFGRQWMIMDDNMAKFRIYLEI